MPAVDYHKAALLTLRDNRILLCRKKQGTSLWILPGGCIEAGETPEQCLVRELQEELGSEVRASDLTFLGSYREAAAGDPAKSVQIELYLGKLVGEPEPHSEIKELVWFGAGDDREQLAPSIANKILPDLVQRGILPW